MKRIAQFFVVGVLLCVLAGCSNQPSASSNSPLPSASPSSEISPTPVLSPSATVAVSPNTAQATTGSEQKPDRRSQRKSLGTPLLRQPKNPLPCSPVRLRQNLPQRRPRNRLPIVTPSHAEAR